MRTCFFSWRAPIVFLFIVISLFIPLQPVMAVESIGPTDKSELEEFMDNIIIDAMKKYNLPGAVFSVVKDDQLFLEKGYGYANLEKETPVDPESTMFRIGSVSKLFTSTAVMQLKEQGRLDFSKDINDYLKGFKIQNKYSNPVTMHNLLTHTAGFDDRWTGVAAPDYSKVTSLGEYLSRNMPEIIREPGTVTQYSNHGMTLAGLIVEEVSGMSFDEYITQNITSPLGMKHTYPRISQEMVSSLALEYTYKNGLYKPMQLYDFYIYPAGSVCSTASDMARFMMAHLNDGTLAGTSILKGETAEEMHSQHFTNSPKLPGMCYGFYEIVEFGHRFIAHGGDTNGTHSFMLLDPEQNMGLFVSTNGAVGQNLIAELIESFIKHYYSENEVPVFAQAYDSVQDSSKKLEGEYRNIRYARNTLDKLVLLLTPQATIRIENNSLILKSPYGEGRYEQIEPLLFRNTENGRYLSFRTDSQGDIAYMFNEIPTFALEKVPWYESNDLHIILIGISVLLSLTWCVYCGIIFVKGIKKKKGVQGRFARRILTFISVSNIVSLVGIIAAILSMDSVTDIGFKLPLIMKLILTWQIALAVLSAMLVIVIFMVWRKGYWRVTGRVYFTLTAVSNICVTIILYYYNMIGIRY